VSALGSETFWGRVALVGVELRGGTTAARCLCRVSAKLCGPSKAISLEDGTPFHQSNAVTGETAKLRLIAMSSRRSSRKGPMKNFVVGGARGGKRLSQPAKTHDVDDIRQPDQLFKFRTRDDN
jgi:hypothetical protein